MKQAEANAEIEIWDVVANRLYYSVFHDASAFAAFTAVVFFRQSLDKYDSFL